MGLSYGHKLTWDEFWNGQENNPSNEFTFLYNGNCYILLHIEYKWVIAEYTGDSAEIGRILASAVETNPGHKNYHNQANWDDMISKCYTVLKDLRIVK
jgi:hypothetical protein